MTLPALQSLHQGYHAGFGHRDFMITGINHITLAVRDVERAFHFYRELLGFKPLCKWPRGAYFLVGDTWFCLNEDAQRNPSTDYTHVAFSVEQKDFAAMVKRLEDAGIESFKKNSSEGDSFYFTDPDGHKLEIHVGNWK